MDTPKLLKVRARECWFREAGKDYEVPRQIVEVLDGESVIGQLPVRRADYEMVAGAIGCLKLELLVERAGVETKA